MTYAKVTQGKRRQIAVTLAPEVVEALDAIATDSLASRSALVEAAITQWLRAQARRKTRTQR
jgi:metal-responsive CopG/Arc/MetJ family transcriptional regulator